MFFNLRNEFGVVLAWRNEVHSTFSLTFEIFKIACSDTSNKQEKLGTMLDKMTRVQSLVTEVGLSLGITEDTLQVIQDAASLAMSDLSSAVVTEFTSLAGVMARHYALRDGYSEQVVSRIPPSSISLEKLIAILNCLFCSQCIPFFGELLSAPSF